MCVSRENSGSWSKNSSSPQSTASMLTIKTAGRNRRPLAKAHRCVVNCRHVHRAPHPFLNVSCNFAVGSRYNKMAVSLLLAENRRSVLTEVHYLATPNSLSLIVSAKGVKQAGWEYWPRAAGTWICVDPGTSQGRAPESHRRLSRRQPYGAADDKEVNSPLCCRHYRADPVARGISAADGRWPNHRPHVASPAT